MYDTLPGRSCRLGSRPCSTTSSRPATGVGSTRRRRIARLVIASARSVSLSGPILGSATNPGWTTTFCRCHEDRLSGKWAKFEAERERILDECRERLAARDLQFLDGWLPNTPYNLDDALAEMLQTLPTNLEPELAQSTLVKTVISQVDKVTTTVGALRYIRNQMSHGAETFEPHDLHVVAVILGRVVRGHLLRLPEASEAAQERVLAPDR
jgi:hypothetical protein